MNKASVSEILLEYWLDVFFQSVAFRRGYILSLDNSGKLSFQQKIR